MTIPEMIGATLGYLFGTILNGALLATGGYYALVYLGAI